MSPKQLWQAYKQVNPAIGDDFDAWSFGAEPDHLAQLVLAGTKTATASAYDEYLYVGEALPQVDDLSVLTDGQHQAVCVLQTTKVKVVPFKNVSAEHADKEGEGDRSLAYWRQVHKELFSQWLSEIDLAFTYDSKVVLEEFQVVYPK